jgi:type I restriction enzyme S subunit
LGSVAFIQGGFAFKSGDFKETGVPVLKIKNVRLREVDTTGTSYVDQAIAKETERYYCKTGDLLISMTGSGPQAPNSVVGRVARFTGPSDKYLINQRVGRFVNKAPDKLDQRYLFYFLAQEETLWKLVSVATGSANQANISGAQIESLELPLPPLAEQKAIAALLGALDDKIELNRRMNATLEAMARTLFQSWFVDFDPVRRNLDRAGMKSTALSSKVLAKEDALFPDSFEDSSLGLIPKGWRSATLGDPELFPLVAPGGLPDSVACMQYIATGDVILDHISAEVPGDLKTLPSRANMRPGLGRIWFAKMKDSPKFLWTMAEDDQWWSSRVLSTGFAGIQATSADYEALLYCFVLSPEFDEAKNGFATGTTMQAVNNETIARIALVVPPPALARRFSDIVRPLFRRRWSNYSEGRSLACLRDTLLPKLLSGEIEISNKKRD